MTDHHALSRRRMITLGAGTLAVAALPIAPGVAAAGSAGSADSPDGRGGGNGHGRSLIPKQKRGTILYTQRDAISRRGVWNNPAPTMGHLGGRRFPRDPSDLGPLQPLPGGFYEVFRYLSSVGFEQVEFAGYGQHADNRGGAAPVISQGGVLLRENFRAYLNYARTLRRFLNDTGLEAIGNHGFIPATWPGGPNGGMTADDHDRFQLELEFASILGMPYMGTGGDPTNSSAKEDWDVAGEKWEALNRLARRWRIGVYPHNHAEAYGFLQDGPMVEVTVDRITGAPLATPQLVRGESGIRKMQYYLDITDPRSCFCEIDLYWAHVAQHRFRWHFDHDGVRRENVLDPLRQVQRQTYRYPLYHAKDGDRTAEAPGVGNGYAMVPFGDPRSDIDYRTFFRRHGAPNYHNANYEQDTAPGGTADPGQSLRFSHISARNMSELR